MNFVFFLKNHLVYYIHLGNIAINRIMNMPTTQKSISGPSPSPLLIQLAEIILLYLNRNHGYQGGSSSNAGLWQHSGLRI